MLLLEFIFGIRFALESCHAGLKFRKPTPSVPFTVSGLWGGPARTPLLAGPPALSRMASLGGFRTCRGSLPFSRDDHGCRYGRRRGSRSDRGGCCRGVGVQPARRVAQGSDGADAAHAADSPPLRGFQRLRSTGESDRRRSPPPRPAPPVRRRSYPGPGRLQRRRERGHHVRGHSALPRNSGVCPPGLGPIPAGSGAVILLLGSRGATGKRDGTNSGGGGGGGELRIGRSDRPQRR